MTKRMLADVFWTAANSELWTGGQKDFSDCAASCVACGYAAESLGAPYDAARSLVESCGVPWGGRISFPSGITDPMKYQGVRYMWLLLAMHVAEDEGLEVSDV